MGQGIPDWARSYCSIMQLMHEPAVLLDEKLDPVWANDAALRAARGGTFFESVRQALFLQNHSTIFDQIRADSTFRLEARPELPALELAPLWEGERLLGCVVTGTEPAAPGASTHVRSVNQMLDTLSHQSRAPLSDIFAALRGIVRINQDEYEDPDLRYYLGRISGQCYRMLRSSINLTEMLRYEHGLAVVSPDCRDLSLFLRQLCRLSSVMIEAAGVEFQFDVPEEPVIVSFDSEKISYVLLNLISNAAKFSGDSPRVMVAMTSGERWASVSVQDNGLGIRSDLLPRVFEPYFSFNPSTESICGDGLGLTVSREIIRRHGGTIALESKEGEGTRVVFSLPLDQGAGGAVSVQDVAGEYLYDRFSNLYVILSDVCKAPDL